METSYDLIVVGHGIVGLAHALAASRAGHRVAVIDRDAQPNGASIRNFGFITVTGQGAPHTWRRARRSRDVWAAVCEEAGIPVLQRGGRRRWRRLRAHRRPGDGALWTGAAPDAPRGLRDGGRHRWLRRSLAGC